MTTNTLTAIITAYCACKVCCGPNAKGITASGNKPKQGITVAIPRCYALSSKVKIEKHTYIGQDRLSKRYDNRFDIYFDNHRDAKQFGIRTNKVIVITP